ncbi:hypothetical protein Daus18300_010470 [Diaporthe australafricana]|uniref:Ankyrin repeat protein n=1 Tax=Diaporthe australafricana TaxID=127596 RepID=A0ABR3WA27_9PEZI
MEKTSPFDYDGPFPFHHIAWSDDPIETRMAWAEQAIAAGHDLNAIYSASLDGNFPKDSQARPLAETLFWPQNYNSATDRIDDLDLLQLYLDQGADPRLKDVRTAVDAVEEARAWRDSGGDGGTHHRYWAQACKMLEARARELDDRDAMAGGRPPRGFLSRLKWQLGLIGAESQNGQQQPVQEGEKESKEMRD